MITENYFLGHGYPYVSERHVNLIFMNVQKDFKRALTDSTSQIPGLSIYYFNFLLIFNSLLVLYF